MKESSVAGESTARSNSASISGNEDRLVLRRSSNRSKHRVSMPVMVAMQSLFTFLYPDNQGEIFQSSPVLIKTFYSNYDMFMVGPTFAPKYRAAIQQTYVHSPNLLSDIHGAMFNACKKARLGSGTFDAAELAPGASSLMKLRTLRINSLHGAHAAMALGNALASFDYMTICGGLSLILRYALESVRPWYADLSSMPQFDPISIALVFWDTISCLLTREVPVVQFRPRHPGLAHHLAGLCTTLLPILYDLCVVGSKLKGEQHIRPSPDRRPHIEEIEQRLLNWKPEVPRSSTESYSRQEIQAMNAQAAMYRSAALVIAHRTLNPIGTDDDVARMRASAVVSELTEYRASTGPDARLHCVAFPLLVASLEIPDIPEELWTSIPSLALAPMCLAKMQALSAYIWTERRTGSSSSMLDLVDQGPHFVAMP